MKFKHVFMATGYSLFISMIAAISIGAIVPSLLVKVAPYACPEGSEPAVYTDSYQHRAGESGTEISLMCESPMEEWDRINASATILAGVFFVPMFLIMLMVFWLKPRSKHPNVDDGIDAILIGLPGIFGFITVAVLTFGVMYEQRKHPADNPNHMFVGENLSIAVYKIEDNVGEPIYCDSVNVHSDEITIHRRFIDAPETSEHIDFEDGDVKRRKSRVHFAGSQRRKRKSPSTSRYFLLSEVPWKRIPSFLPQALAAAQLDSGRIVRFGVSTSKKGGLQISVDVKGFEYKTTVVFDQDGTQVSLEEKVLLDFTER